MRIAGKVVGWTCTDIGEVAPPAAGDPDTTPALPDDDYEIYEGLLGDFNSHEPKFCSTAVATSRTAARARRRW